MSQAYSEEIILTVLISTLLLLGFVLLAGYFFIQQQKKRFLHQREVLELRESFNQTILQSKLEIQERTLDHIAKELHANFSHLVSLININLSVVIAQSTGEVREQINETKLLAKELMQEVKALSVSLNSDFIMKAGFIKAFENELYRLKKTKKYEVSYHHNGVPVRMPSGQEIVLYRLCQEILNNIVKHAKANKISVLLDYRPEKLYLSIEDDGIGFDKQSVFDQAVETESTGLSNMVGRAKLINGEFEIKTTPGEGTRAEITIPFNISQFTNNDI